MLLFIDSSSGGWFSVSLFSFSLFFSDSGKELEPSARTGLGAGALLSSISELSSGNGAESESVSLLSEKKTHG